MSQQVDEANYLLKRGEFEKSKLIFSNLLDIDPENPDLITGFFISSYWDNRIEKILSTPEGKERGLLLNHLFDEFEREYLRRKYHPLSGSFDSAMLCILEESCQQLKLGFQKLGPQSFEKDKYLLLAKNLLRTKEYKNCIEILEYSKKFYDTPPDYYFYKAECYFHLGEEKKSRILFRSALLYYSEKIPIHLIRSEPLFTAWTYLNENYTEEEALYYLPVYCLEKNLLPEMLEYSKEEIRDLWVDIQKFQDGIGDTDEATRMRIKYNIIHYGITILDSFHGQINQELSRRVVELIKTFDQGILERRKMNQKKEIENEFNDQDFG